MNSNSDIYTELLKAREDIGSLTSSVNSVKELMQAHVLSSTRLDARVVLLEAAIQRQAGAAKVLTLLWSAIAAAVGYFLRGGHH